MRAICKVLGLQQTVFRTIINRWRHLGTVVNRAGSGDPSKSATVAQGIKLKLKCTWVLQQNKHPGKAAPGWFEKDFTFWRGLVEV